MAEHEELPGGYRQAITTAITVFLGFSITFLRTFWDLKSQGGWTIGEATTEIAVAVGILIQIYCLLRSLSLKDNSPDRYETTAKIFMLAIIIVVCGFVVSVFFRL